MVRSQAPFARKFPRDDPVLDLIDTQLLNRTSGWFTPGAWCLGTSSLTLIHSLACLLLIVVPDSVCKYLSGVCMLHVNLRTDNRKGMACIE